MKKIASKMLSFLLGCILFVALIGCTPSAKRDYSVQAYAEQQKNLNTSTLTDVNMYDSEPEPVSPDEVERLTEAGEIKGVIVNENDIPEGKKVEYKKRSLNYGIEDLSYFGANDNITYVGSMLKINADGTAMSPIVGLKRKPLTLSLSLEGATGIDYKVEKVNSVTQSAVGQAVNNLLKGVAVDGAQLPYIVAMQLTEVKAKEEINAALGLSFNARSYFNFSSEFDFSNKGTDTYAILTLKQIYFTVNADYNAEDGVYSLLDDGVTLQQLQTACPADYCPVYVSSVSYGRIAAITMKTSDSFSQLKSKIKIGGGGIFSKADLNTQMGIIKEQESIECNCFIYGGSVNQEVLTSTSISEMLVNLNQPYDPTKQVGKPISYQLSHISDNSSARLGFVGEYYYAEFVDKKTEVTPDPDKTTGVDAKFDIEKKIIAGNETYNRYGAYEISTSKYLSVDVSKIDLEYLKYKGLNLKITITLSIREEDKGYQELYVYNSGVTAKSAQKGDAPRIAGIVIEHGGTALKKEYSTYEFIAIIAPDEIKSDELWIVFDANGKYDDVWFAKDIKFSLESTDKETRPMYSRIVK